MKRPRDAEGRLAAGPRAIPDHLAAQEPSTTGGREPARLEIRFVLGEPIGVRVVAGDEVGEIMIREALAEREIGLCAAVAVWEFASRLGLIEPLEDFDPAALLQPAVRRAP